MTIPYPSIESAIKGREAVTRVLTQRTYPQSSVKVQQEVWEQYLNGDLLIRCICLEKVGEDDTLRRAVDEFQVGEGSNTHKRQSHGAAAHRQIAKHQNSTKPNSAFVYGTVSTTHLIALFEYCRKTQILHARLINMGRNHKVHQPGLTAQILRLLRVHGIPLVEDERKAQVAVRHRDSDLQERREVVREGYHQMEKSHIELLEENEQLKRDLDDARRALKEKNGGTQDLEAGYEKDIHKPITGIVVKKVSFVEDTPRGVEPSGVAEDEPNEEPTSDMKFDPGYFMDVSSACTPPVVAVSTPHVLSSVPPWTITTMLTGERVLLCGPSNSIWSPACDRLLGFFPHNESMLCEGYQSVACSQTCEVFRNDADSQSWAYRGTFQCIGISEMYHGECKSFLKHRPDIVKSLWNKYDAVKPKTYHKMRIRDDKEMFLRCCAFIKVQYNKQTTKLIDAHNQPKPRKTAPKRKADDQQCGTASKKSKPNTSISQCEHSSGWTVLDDSLV
ncbi:hypothetical protein FOMPIDRAFT_1059339 [Fomitopsis schrenkii]|uniref:Uncharacterized protein n=1 Tax=Fomitopsis schrenkii TaxID=2126942 RepID=S8EBM4_FOMSC|nr:hypothetical protein FOMPIDRAFT_1059339 [Fomitopsis schrenkii]